MKSIKALIQLAVIVGVCVLCFKVYQKFENREPVKIDREEQKRVQFGQAVSMRLLELEKTSGGGRVRMNVKVENEARRLYNSRNLKALPMLEEKNACNK